MKKLFERYAYFWKNTFNFKDTLSRREYWLTVLSILIVSLTGSILLSILALITGNVVGFFVLFGIYGLYGLALFIPGLSMNCRRALDVGIKIEWYIIPLVLNMILSGVSSASDGFGSSSSVSPIIALISLICVVWNYYVLLSPSNKHASTKYIGRNA